MSHNCVS